MLRSAIPTRSTELRRKTALARRGKRTIVPGVPARARGLPTLHRPERPHPSWAYDSPEVMTIPSSRTIGQGQGPAAPPRQPAPLPPPADLGDRRRWIALVVVCLPPFLTP